MKTFGRVALFYIVALFLCVMLGGLQMKVLKIDFFIISLPQLAPALTALIMLALFKKDNARLTLAITRTQMLKYLGAIGLPLLVSGVLFLCYNRFVAPLSVQPLSWTALLILLASNLVGAFGEELGWRGYLQRIVEGKANVFPASLLVGVLWGLWHFLYYGNGPIYMLFFVLALTAASVIIGWLLMGTDYNVVIATLFHFVMDISFYPLASARADVRLMMLWGLVWVVVAMGIIMFNRKAFLSPRRKNVDG